jgi:hypothetical protein
MQGMMYLKTLWGWRERPVASAKLNTWDDRVEAALDLCCHLLATSLGGSEGILRDAASDTLRVVATDPPGMAVDIRPGTAMISGYPFRLAAATRTRVVPAPVALPRVDLVQARLDTWDVTIREGSEAASPAPPATESGCIALARLWLRPGMTCIQNADDGINGYVTDVRAFL